MFSRSSHSLFRQFALPALLLASVIGTALRAQETGSDAGPLLTLEEAIQLALKHNKQIDVGSYYVPIAKANVLTAYGQFDPALNFSRTYTEDGAPRSFNPLVQQVAEADTYNLALEGLTPWGLSYSLGANAVHQRTLYNNLRFDSGYSSFAGVTVTQPLLRGFGFGANLIGLRLAKADRAIADWQFREVVIATVTNVKIAYNYLALAHQRLRLFELSKERGEALLQENEKRFKVGGISDSAVIEARARTALRVEAIVVARQQLRDAENDLRQLIGEEKFTAEGPLYTLQELPSVDETIQPAVDLQRAYELRPDYQALRLGLVKNRAQLAYARNQILPRLDFVGSYGYAGLDESFATSRRMVRDRDNRAYTAGLVVSIPLTFASGRGQARAARLQLQQDEADLARFAQEIAVRVSAAAGQIDNTRQRVAANRSSYDLQRQVLDGQLKLLRAGSGSTYNVLNYQETLSQVELSLATALTAQRVAAASYDREIGRTLERNQITLEN